MSSARQSKSEGAGVVVVAYDGSEAARRALLHAAGIVRPSRRLTVVNVIPAQSISARLQTVTDKQREGQRRLLGEAQELLAGRGVEAELVAAVGEPLTEILAAAERAGAGTLVVGRAARRRPLPSLGDRLVRRAKCDVLVVH